MQVNCSSGFLAFSDPDNFLSPAVIQHLGDAGEGVVFLQLEHAGLQATKINFGAFF
jgi:hypothetical protein